MKNLKLVALVVVLFAFLLSSCGGPKKCGGGRGSSVEMGTM
jgi:hypothetical protein